MQLSDCFSLVNILKFSLQAEVDGQATGDACRVARCPLHLNTWHFHSGYCAACVCGVQPKQFVASGSLTFRQPDFESSDGTAWYHASCQL